MDSKENLLLKARSNPSILDQLAEEYSAASLGYPAGLAKVAECGGRGRGLVAARMIKKGEQVYEESTGMEVELTEDQLRSHLIAKTPEERRTFLMHCYCHDGVLWCVLGIDRWVYNHPHSPHHPLHQVHQPQQEPQLCGHQAVF